DGKHDRDGPAPTRGGPHGLDFPFHRRTVRSGLGVLDEAVGRLHEARPDGGDDRRHDRELRAAGLVDAHAAARHGLHDLDRHRRGRRLRGRRRRAGRAAHADAGDRRGADRVRAGVDETVVLSVAGPSAPWRAPNRCIEAASPSVVLVSLPAGGAMTWPPMPSTAMLTRPPATRPATTARIFRPSPFMPPPSGTGDANVTLIRARQPGPASIRRRPADYPRAPASSTRPTTTSAMPASVAIRARGSTGSGSPSASTGRPKPLRVAP